MTPDLAIHQDDTVAAAEYVTADVDNWIDDRTVGDEWAHDWRKFIAANARASRDRRCDICGHPVVTWGKDLAACSKRHWKALQGTLLDEQCRLCNQVTVCAFDLDGSPVCADCWPGERLLADRRAVWARKMGLATEEAAS